MHTIAQKLWVPTDFMREPPLQTAQSAPICAPFGRKFAGLAHKNPKTFIRIAQKMNYKKHEFRVGRPEKPEFARAKPVESGSKTEAKRGYEVQKVFKKALQCMRKGVFAIAALGCCPHYSPESVCNLRESRGIICVCRDTIHHSSSVNSSSESN